MTITGLGEMFKTCIKLCYIDVPSFIYIIDSLCRSITLSRGIKPGDSVGSQ